MGSVVARSAIKSYVADMQRQLADMLEELGDPLAPEARKLALSLTDCGAEQDYRPPA